VGLACVLSALEACPKHDIPQHYRQNMVDAAYWNDQIDCTEDIVHQFRVQLRTMFQTRMKNYTIKKNMIMAERAKLKERLGLDGDNK